MSPAAAVAHWWDVPPRRQVSHLSGAAPELLTVALDPLPSAAPAVVSFRPAPPGSPGDQVHVVLRELDKAAISLYPLWLPGAETLDGPSTLGVAAVRTLAERAAAGSHNFGPFLADLASRSLRRLAFDRPPSFPPEVRAAGLARVIAAAYGRSHLVVIVELPDDLGPAAERALVHAAEWLVHHGGVTVWLAGAPLRSVDRVRSVRIALPPSIAALPAEAAALGLLPARPAPGPRVTYPPRSGFPRADSEAEQALERALAKSEWARGRRWNHDYEPDILGRRYRLDLFWPAERLVVEVDGDDHRGAAKFADDHRRDVHLQLHGNDVLRFTNEQVLTDVLLVVHNIRQLLEQRRRGPSQ
ncbi:endonuclease domain-containing protein [Dactylosporangium sp. CA-233914]|uniref:endonuclease domain-containing protein n=1 Tax=Dactylosporangium sp. CA-233914 TaxID=3239934 RepID=UPI003D8FEFB5